MAPRFIAFAMLVLLALSQLAAAASALEASADGGRHLLTWKKKINCAQACYTRCEVASVNDRCNKYCNICCKECNCVPSGHYGNKDECACYAKKKSSKGTSKCP